MTDQSNIRLKLVIRGAVQGVGFRPFIYRLALEIGLNGYVINSSLGVIIEVEGSRDHTDEFLTRLPNEQPPRSFIQSLESSYLDPAGFDQFEIQESSQGVKTALVLPDISTCPDCLSEVFDPDDRRYLYPFTNCTNCGPRFSIIEELPYDRPGTTMGSFAMCTECQAEYEDPLDRRFHAQPNACPKCGPHLEWQDRQGKTVETHHEALLAAVEAIRGGFVVALKGLGGFHLIVDASNEEAVWTLRHRKQREEKPLALMVPGVGQAQRLCEISAGEARLLESPESPIVLLRKRQGGSLAPNLAPGNPWLGIMLPYTPLHHVLLSELEIPVVATSGNLSDEPICITREEALSRLGEIADYFLMHNRPIARHVDDSIARVVLNRELILRRARGYAPLPIHMKRELPVVLGVGAHLKNAVALSVGDNIFVSQHIGDLETPEAFSAFNSVIESFKALYEVEPESAVCDDHPDYLSTHYARSSQIPILTAQHHYAHVLACMAENEVEPPVLGISWDGTGYGLDGTVWGGEFLEITDDHFLRRGHLREFLLPGGEQAIQYPARTAVGLLFEVFGHDLWGQRGLPPIDFFSAEEQRILSAMMEKGINSPRTSSAGRLFDGVSSLLGIRQEVRFEGQAAMELEFATEVQEEALSYPFLLSQKDEGDSEPGTVVDWQPMIFRILQDLDSKPPIGYIAAKFHRTLSDMILAFARQAGLRSVVLTGGCFQNRLLLESAVISLRQEGFRPYWHQRFPPNDGGIALGQVIAALRQGKD